MFFKFTNHSEKTVFVNLDHYDVAFQKDGTAKLWPNSRSSSDCYNIGVKDAARLKNIMLRAEHKGEAS